VLEDAQDRGVSIFAGGDHLRRVAAVVEHGCWPIEAPEPLRTVPKALLERADPQLLLRATKCRLADPVMFCALLNLPLCHWPCAEDHAEPVLDRVALGSTTRRSGLLAQDLVGRHGDCHILPRDNRR